MTRYDGLAVTYHAAPVLQGCFPSVEASVRNALVSRREELAMPMIDVYAAAGTFADPATLTQSLAATLMEVEQVPPIALFRENTAAFLHEVVLSDVNGSGDHVRVQVLTNAGALDRAKQVEAVRRLSRAIADAAGDPSLVERTWVLLTETYDGGWGIAGHANTNAEIVDLARRQLSSD